MINKKWFKIWAQPKYPSPITDIVQSWSVPFFYSENEKELWGSYSACSTWGVFKDSKGHHNVIFLSLYHGILDTARFLMKAKNLSLDYFNTEGGEYHSDMRPHKILIGHQELVWDLRKRGIEANEFIHREGNTLTERLNKVIPYLEDGRVYLRTSPQSNHLDLMIQDAYFMEICMGYPSPESYALVNSFVQAILYLKAYGILKHSQEEDIIDSVDRPNINFYHPLRED